MIRVWKKFRSLNRGAQIGGIAGFGAFLVFGLFKAIYVGGFIGLGVAGRLYGVPVEPSLAPVLLVFAGMVIAVLFLITIFVGAGLLIGGGIGRLAGARSRELSEVSARREELEPAELEKKRPARGVRHRHLPPKPAWHQLDRGNGYADTGRRVGGFLGLGLFALFGLWPTLFLGGALGLGLAADIFGTPVPETFITGAMVLIGMALFTAALMAVATAVGAVVGTFVGYLASLAVQSAQWVGEAIAAAAVPAR